MHYIQPDDGNLHDNTVLRIPLNEAVLPGDSIRLRIVFWPGYRSRHLHALVPMRCIFLWLNGFLKLGAIPPMGGMVTDFI